MFEVARTAELRSRGMSKRATNSLLRVPGVPGVRVLGDPPDDLRLLRARAAMERAPAGAVLSGWAAAVVHGVTPRFLDGTTDGSTLKPIDLSVPADVGSYDTRGLRIRRSRVPESHREEVDGFLVTSGPRTTLDLARWAPTAGTRLGMLDVGARFGMIQRDPFADFLDPLGGLHRLAQVRALFPHISARAESVPESEMRYHWIQAGLPAPVVNQPVYDRLGHFVARVDLCDPETGLVGEYQGFPHRVDLAGQLDEQRATRLRGMNMTIAEVWNEDRPRTEAILLEQHAEALRRDARLDAWICPEVEDW
ncbi:hypothetical protein [Ornithinimicrobium murale]|uniref:hypothetical protein n=1 Tax=Ornithinimicrobium murale TaxID=1050153 RepID=UPI0013B426A9|nr:hypothetical protein [Ornithinimicrobium murale]